MIVSAAVNNFSPIPTDLLPEITELRLSAAQAFQRREWKQATEKFDEAYAWLRHKQDSLDVRFHKGWELHNCGIALLRIGEFESAAKKLLYAYCEDVLSTDQGNEAYADQELASKVLRDLANVEGLMDAIKKAGLQAKEENSVPRLPDALFDRALALQLSLVAPEGSTTTSETVADSARKTATGRRKDINDLAKPFDRRCFVGSNYHNVDNLPDIRDMVEEADYEAIVAQDFEMDFTNTHRRCLLLLHQCSKAIFEVSTPAGQLMELERCRDYNIKPLIVAQVLEGGDLQISQMIRSMAEEEVKYYSRVSDLRPIISEYLEDPPESKAS